MSERLYDVTSTATAAADGTATVRIVGPGDAFDVLIVDLISVTSTSGLLPDCTLYRGNPADGRRLAYNPDGQTGTFEGGGTADRITSGDVWSLRWTGADPGAVCTASITGTVRRR